MKFPRNAKILRSPFEMAPFAAVFFLLVIFLMLAALLPVPGIPFRLQPPAAGDLPGIDKPTVAMAVDSGGRLYFANQIVSEAKLKSSLSNAVEKIPRAAHARHSRRQNRDGRPVDASGVARAQCRHPRTRCSPRCPAPPAAPPGHEWTPLQIRPRPDSWSRAETPGEGWSRHRWLTLVAIVFAVQVDIIFALGEKQFPPPRAVKNVPQLTLADNSNELVALERPDALCLAARERFRIRHLVPETDCQSALISLDGTSGRIAVARR